MVPRELQVWLGAAELRIFNLNSWMVDTGTSLPAPKQLCCVSTPWKHLRRGYLLVISLPVCITKYSCSVCTVSVFYLKSIACNHHVCKKTLFECHPSKYCLKGFKTTLIMWAGPLLTLVYFPSTMNTTTI